MQTAVVHALSADLTSGSLEVIQDIEEITALSHELLSSDISTSDLIGAIMAFSTAAIYTFRLEDTKLPSEKVLREVEMIIPESDVSEQVSEALSHCLTYRFQAEHEINDYEEAIAIADKVLFAAYSPGAGDGLTLTQRNAIELIRVLVASRLNLHSSPENLDDAIHRFRTLLSLPSLSDQDLTDLAVALDHYSQQRLRTFVVAHPSISAAYETAMSLMQETLVFSPTLQTQHFCLAHALGVSGGLPSDYASYQVEMGQIKQALETLERGRALLWSEMRDLRPSTAQVRAADPALADKLKAINQRLESVTMSVAQSQSEEIGDSRTGAGRRERTDSIGHLVITQRKLLEEPYPIPPRLREFPEAAVG